MTLFRWRASGATLLRLRATGATSTLLLVALAATLLVPQAAAAGDSGGDDEVLVVRYACLIGGREAGTAPTSSGVMSREELVDFLLEWKPQADNDEVRQVFALNALGELARHASQLPLRGGSISGSFAHGDSSFEIGLRIRPAYKIASSGREGMGVGVEKVDSELKISAEIRRGGELLSGPTKIHYTLGERAIVTFTRGPEAPFLFLVLDVDRMSVEELERRGLRYSWNKNIRLVDGEDVTAPVAIEKTQPAYPEEGRKAKHQGRVVLRTVIDEQGLVQDVEVIEGQPYGLSEAAIDAVRTWRFQPALYEGEPVAVIYILTINFRLE